jgi:predicted aspartyl protease
MAQSRAKVWFAAVLMAAPALGASASDERAIIPFEMNGFDHMVVQLEINGLTSTTGVIDTAATFAMVDSTAAMRSGVLEPDAASRTVNILGVNGDQDYPVVRLDSILAGNLRMHAVDAAYNDHIEVPGAANNVLPASAFPGDVLEFDFETRTISAYDGKPDVKRSHYAGAVKYSDEGGLIFIGIRINGKSGQALIDTGSSLSYVNTTFARQSSMRHNEELTHRIFGATGDSESAWIGSARKIQIADFYVKNPSLMVSDPVLLERLGLDDEPVMVLGLDFLSKFRLQFDRRKRQLILSIPEDGAGVGLDLSAEATRLKPLKSR